MPSENDWGFEKIEAEEPERAFRLARADSPQSLIRSLTNALREAFSHQAMWIGFDGAGNDLSAPRATIQFRVPVGLYDWFHNARSGYRAQFWNSAKAGEEFNTHLISSLRAVIEATLPASADVGRKIRVEKHGNDRQDFDEGHHIADRTTILASLEPRLSRIWICERPINGHIGLLQDYWMTFFRPPWLNIPKWRDAGLFAPCPMDGDAWLDIKGAYVGTDGLARQPNKSQEEYANAVNRTGWS